MQNDSPGLLGEVFTKMKEVPLLKIQEDIPGQPDLLCGFVLGHSWAAWHIYVVVHHACFLQSQNDPKVRKVELRVEDEAG